MATWRYIAERLHGDGTATPLHPDLPLRNTSIEYALSGPGGLSCTIQPENLALMGGDGRPVFREWSTAIWAEEDGILRGGGIVDYIGVSNSELSIECAGFSGYLRDQPYVGSAFYIETDPMDIARLIWAHVQGERGGNLGVTLDATKSPVRIGTDLKQVEFDTQEGPVSFESGPYKLEWWQTHDLLNSFESLARETPFEFREQVSWNPDGTIRKHINMGYPTIGSRRTDLRFAIGENVNEVPDVEFAGENFANGVLFLGAGEGRTMVRGAYDVMDGRLRRVAVVQDKQVRSLKAANSRARQELALRRGDFDVRDLVVRDHLHAPLGSFSVGDEILVEGDLGWVDNVSGVWARVVGMTVTPENPDSMRLSILRTDKVTA